MAVTYTPPKPYTPPKYDETKYRKGINTTYYDKAITNYTTQAEKQRATQLGEAKKTQDSALKQAYITRAQNERALKNNLAMAGIRGGATETSNLGLQNQYGTAVGAANNNYANSVNTINQNIDQNIADYRSDMESRAEEYRQTIAQERWKADREAAQAKWNAKREDSLTQYNAQMEFWNNYYLDKYSGYSKKALKKAEKTVKAKLKKAKTQEAKIRWQQALRGIGNRRGVIANKK